MTTGPGHAGPCVCSGTSAPSLPGGRHRSAGLLFDRIRNLSMRDSLTDLYNHRHSMELVANEFHRLGRYEGGVTE